MKHIKTIGFLLILLGLSGCASTPQSVSNQPITHWVLRGKIAIIYPGTHCNRESCPKQSDQGRIHWQQQAEHYQVTLFDPFGRRVMTIVGDDQALKADQPNHPSIHTTPQNLVSLMTKNRRQNELFSTLDPQDLRYWITGRAVPKQPIQQQKPHSFMQKGFTVNSRQWRETDLGFLPSLITVTKEDLVLRLVIQQWGEDEG